MARATRSTAAQEKDRLTDPPPHPRKNGSKKRKRTSLADVEDQPAVKQSRTDEGIKEESSHEPEEQPHTPNTKRVELPDSGDLPINSVDAERILEILEVADTQGLLDRVFPLHSEQDVVTTSDPGTVPSTNPQSYSFRALLRDHSRYPLRVLRTAVRYLFPISSHPRSRPSAPAAEQLRFCNLALSLLDQASFNSSPVPLDAESILPQSIFPEQSTSTEVEDAQTPTPGAPSSSARRRKYALVQRLPTGDWWTSTNSGNSSLSADGKELKDLRTGHAELVAIFPSAPSAAPSPPVTLGSYVVKRPPVPTQNLSEGRRTGCGKFLDYGPYSSFAPTFDQEGVEVGRVALGEVVYYQELKRRDKRLRGKQVQTLNLGAGFSERRIGDEMMGSEVSSSSQQRNEEDENADALEGLLSSEQVASIKASLGSLELEDAVQELLERNARALRRLEELQRLRLCDEGGGSSTVEVGSEEWEIAQGILDSLTLLASLRPRASIDGSDSVSLIPTASALRKLHRTLPVGSTEGWYGTLPATRATALRDDTTIHVKSGAAAPVVATPIPAPPVAAKTTAPAAAYSGYPYPNYTTGQYRGGYGTYTPGQTGSYYPSYHPPAATASQTVNAAHYPNQQYATAGQQQYGYSPWYNYQPQPAPSTTGTTSGRTTPQPAAPTSAMPSNYASFFASTQQQPQTQRAVANTVLSATANKGYQPGTWTNGPTAGYAPPTLPPHLRSTIPGSSTPGTPQPVTSSSGVYQGYYANYQPGAQPVAQ